MPAPYTPTTVTSGFGQETVINSNFNAIASALAGVLNRLDSSSNTMEVDLDMNSNQILNLVASTSDSAPVRNDQVATLIASAIATFATDNFTSAVTTIATDIAQSQTAAYLASTSATDDIVTVVGSTAGIAATITALEQYTALTTVTGVSGDTVLAFDASNSGSAVFIDIADLLGGASTGGSGVSTSSLSVTAFTYDSKSFSAAGQSASMTGMATSRSGHKVYLVGGNTAYQYTMSTPGAISTLSYDSVSFGFSSLETNTQGVELSADGSHLYVFGFTNDTIYQIDMSTPYALSTGTDSGKSFSVATQSPILIKVRFDKQGYKFWVNDEQGDIHQYICDTAFDISTAHYSNVEFSTTAESLFLYGATFADEGRVWLGAADDDNVIHQYYVETPYSLKTASYSSKTYNILSDVGVAGTADICMLEGDDKLYYLDYGTDTIYQISTNF